MKNLKFLKVLPVFVAFLLFFNFTAAKDLNTNVSVSIELLDVPTGMDFDVFAKNLTTHQVYELDKVAKIPNVYIGDVAVTGSGNNFQIYTCNSGGSVSYGGEVIVFVGADGPGTGLQMVIDDACPAINED